MDNTPIVVVFIPFTVSLIFQTSPQVARGVCDLWRRLKLKLVYSPLFFPACWRMANAAVRGLIWASPVTLHFFFHSSCVLKRCSPLYFEPKPNLSKTLEGLLMQLAIFVNTIFQLNSLNITVSILYASRSKMNKKERSCLSLFVCFCVPPC